LESPEQLLAPHTKMKLKVKNSRADMVCPKPSRAELLKSSFEKVSVKI
jgi:hypothetical protein